MKKPIIVESQSAFLDSLFKPIEGKTADGYVVKRTKNTCVVWLHGKEYTINTWLCWLKRDTVSKVYQFAVLDLPYTLTTLTEVAESLCVKRYWVNGEIRSTFKA